MRLNNADWWTARRLLVAGALILALAGCNRAQPAPPTAAVIGQFSTPKSTSTPTPTPRAVPTAMASATPLPPTPAPTEPPASPPASSTPPPPSAPSSTPAPIDPPPTPAACSDLAVFVDDITIPDETNLKQDEPFRKVWRLRNVGDCTWEGYRLVFSEGEIMNAPLENPIPPTAPGATVDIAVDMVAPGRGGRYAGNWELLSAGGERFGLGSDRRGKVWVIIRIGFFLTPTPTLPAGAGAPTPAPAAAGCAATRNTDFEAQVLALMNQARQEAGLPALEVQSQLSAAAFKHSLDMSCANFVNHIGSDGGTWFDRVSAQGYASYSTARENIYVGSPDFGGNPQGAFTWWMNSKVHRDNILFATVTEVGIGYAFNPNSDYGGYYTVVFARP